MTKLKDVAALAGVSVSTASKALNNYPGINDETRAKVLAVARKLNYSPNPNARQMVTGKSHILGILTSDTYDNGLMHPFYGVVIESFRKYVNKHGYDVIIIPSDSSYMNMTYVEYSNYRMLDGVYVLRYSELDDNLIDLLDSDIPTITTDVNYLGIPIVSSSDIEAAYVAYEYLYSQGHRDIFHLAGPLDSLAGQLRLRGFREAQHIHEKEHAIHKYTVEEVEGFDYQSGVDGILRMLRKRDNKLPDAIIAASDIVAMGSINTLVELGYSVPDDVSIIGFDNLEFSSYSRPKLTTMAQDTKKLGELTGELLIREVAGQRIAKNTDVPMQLIVRESVKSRTKP